MSKHQFDAKVKAIALLGSKCAKCPEIHPAALQFHHLDPLMKSFNLSSKTLVTPNKYPWSVIEAEIEKCELLCGNCHAKIHTNWNQWMDEVVAMGERMLEPIQNATKDLYR